MANKERPEEVANIGEIIKNLRNNKDLRVEDVSSLLNYTPQAYSHWENGRRSMSIEILKQLSSILDFKAIIDEGKLFIEAKSNKSLVNNNTEKEDELKMNVIFRKAINGPLEPMVIEGNLFEGVRKKISAFSIEVIRIREDIAVLIDEDAIYKKEHKTNFWYDAWYSKDGTEHKLYPRWILGDIVFVGIQPNDEGEEFIGLTDEQCKFIEKYLYD